MAGPAIGPMIALEVLTSFFLEAGFLGIMLFGLHRVGPKLHFFATCMVALGTLLSASWILSANSWMQTPDGIADGERASRRDRLAEGDRQSVLALSTATHAGRRLSSRVRFSSPAWVPGICCAASTWRSGIGRSRSAQLSRLCSSPGQVFLGDILYGTMLKYQPAKMQAAEGFWEQQSQSPAPYYWIHRSGPAKPAQSFHARHALSRQHLADP